MRQDGVTVVLADRRRTQIDALDPAFRERLQFIGLADAILIQVAPDTHRVELVVGGAEDAIAIRVQLGQRGETVGGLLAVRQHGLIPEQLRTRVDRAVAVAVEDEHAVVRTGPRSRGPHGIAVGIEQNGWGFG